MWPSSPGWNGPSSRIRLAAAAATVAAAAVAGAVLLAPSPSSAHPLARAARCPVFPASNPWNRRVDRLPVARDSARLIATIGLGGHVHPDFGSGTWDGGPIGIPYVVLKAGRPRPAFARVRFAYPSESDPGPYPIPAGVPIEGGPMASGDRHAIVVDARTCRDYELFDLRRSGSAWTAGSGAVFDLRSNRLRPAGWTSADAAGLPILPGLARWSDLASGSIDHALRFTAPCTAARYVYPARHDAPTCGRGFYPPMGLRVRLKSSVSLAGLGPQARIVALALRRYGMILADNGSSWYVSGAPDPHWNNEDLHTLGRLTGRDFQVVGSS